MEVPSVGGSGMCNVSGAAPQASTPERNLSRAQRDQQMILRHESRGLDRLLDRYQDDSGTVGEIKKRYQTFADAVAQAYSDLNARGGEGYADFAQTVFRARQDYRRSIRELVGDTPGQGGPGGPDAPDGPRNGRGPIEAQTAAPMDTPSVNTSNLDRARRDMVAITRHIDREFESLAGQLGDASAEQVEKLRKGFAERLDQEFQGFVNSGAGDYLGFAERLASMRRAMSNDLRALAGSAGTTTTPTTAGTSAVASESATSSASIAADTRAAASGENASTDSAPSGPAYDARNYARAERDRASLVRGLDREFETLLRRVGGNEEAAGKLKDLRDSFLGSLDGLLENFKNSGASDYMGFAADAANARMGLTRQFQAILASSSGGIDTTG